MSDSFTYREPRLRTTNPKERRQLVEQRFPGRLSEMDDWGAEPYNPAYLEAIGVVLSPEELYAAALPAKGILDSEELELKGIVTKRVAYAAHDWLAEKSNRSLNQLPPKFLA